MATSHTTLDSAAFIQELQSDAPIAYTARSIDASEIELWAVTESGRVLSCQISKTEVVPSLAANNFKIQFWEREMHQMFGVNFTDPASNQPLFVGAADWVQTETLAADRLLARRNLMAWPGAKEPGVDNPVGKRRLLPPGVNPDVKPEELL